MSLPLKFVSHRIEEYALQVTYDPEEDRGHVIYNLSLLQEEDLESAMRIVRDVARAGLMVSDRVRLLVAGEKIGGFMIPAGQAGVCTICSLTLDGLLLRKGIPTRSIGGGILEIEDWEPRRFIHLIQYEHTTIDPLQVLASQDLTSILEVMQMGNGTILANVREVHMEAEHAASQILDLLVELGFMGVLEMGAPNIPLLGMPVSPHYLGIAMVGGTNPMAAMNEGGIKTTTLAMKGVIPVEELPHLEEC
ncbi:MAG: DUF128 domain-containing protein [Methanomicrobiales archaeon]|nr:DUF128 domain-containing protein [Methanomicrobiales archaeon]